MTDVLNVERRNETGSARIRRLRKSGKIPAVLYGHGEECVSLSIDSRQVAAMLRHGGHIVELTGAVKESALIKQVQWDALGMDVLHLDLARVDASESVEVELSIELRGEAPGTHQGGILKHMLHEITVRCAANQLPERIEVSINHLELDQSVLVRDITVPEAVEVLNDPDDVVVLCTTPMVTEEEEPEVAEGVAEPEVIGRKAEEGAEEDSE